MTDYFVGIGGNDGNDGPTWAQRFLTLNAAEDEPVVANDTVYVGPGVYREMLTCDVSGSSGQPITYIGDVSGENTDGVGGIVRVTGSDDDQSGTRTACIYANAKSYRTFRGFALDMATNKLIWTVTSCDNWIIEDCYFGDQDDDSHQGIYLNCASDNLFTVRRCIFINPGYSIYIYNASDISVNASSIIENCLILGGVTNVGNGIYSNNVDSFTVKNCLVRDRNYGIRVSSFTVSNNIDVNNCLIANCLYALYASVSGEIIENYNSIPLSNTTPRTNVNVGGSSNTYPALFEMPVLLDTFTQYPWKFGELSEWSELRGIAGSSEASDDLYGADRPATSSKKSWGAVQYKPGERETTTTYDSSAASIKLADAGRHQMYIPVTAASTTIAVYCYREANYAGTNPQMIIRQPGQAAETTTDAAAASQWNELSDTITPDAGTDYVIVELVSNNTATSGSYASFFDALSVS